MIKDVITYLNNRITTLGYFNDVLCLAEKIERESKVYPALYNNNNEYNQINLDVKGSLSYWRKNGDVTFSRQDNETSIGVQYLGTIPLKLVGFIKKEAGTNDAYFADNICTSLIANLTVSNSALKQMLKAKRATITATGYNTDARSVVGDEYDNVDFEVRYTHAYFSIDFELTFTTNSQCYADLCEALPPSWGFVTVTDGATVTEVPCGTTYTCTGGGGDPATVRNSDSTYSTTVACGGELVLPAETINVYLDGVLNQSVSGIPLGGTVINISL